MATATTITSSNMTGGHLLYDSSHYDYGHKNVQAYADYSKNKHGPDGGLFLDPYFVTLIQNLHGEKVLDIGCGAGPWSIYAAQNGGIVSGIDLQEGMIEAAKKATQEAGLSDKIEYLVGDAANLPYESNFFDRVISICVGCNLPKEIFKKHIEEMQRTLRTDGGAAVAAPNSLHVVFSDGKQSEQAVHQHIQEVLEMLPDNPSREDIADQLSQLTEVLSATFYMKGERLTLLTYENEIEEGSKIWRKLPQPVVPNFYYPLQAYKRAFQEIGAHQITFQPQFPSEIGRHAYNAIAPENEKLGPSYTSHAPFVVFLMTKSNLLPVAERGLIPGAVATVL